jgi:DNA-binding LacI/PurR family transcriptional regulator
MHCQQRNGGRKGRTLSKAGPANGKAKRKPITARELARLIGVSQSAVSRAFTPGASIAPGVREKILRYAADVDYHPNAIASMLSKSRTNIVGIVVSEMQNPFYPLLLEKLSRALQRIGLQSLLFNITKGSNLEDQLSALRRYNVDAVIVLSATVLSGPTLSWATEGRAAILVGRVVEDADLCCVTCDNGDGARAIADHFHELGRRRVAYVAGLSHTSTNMERQNAFITRVAELGMTLTTRINGGEYSYDAGRRSALEIAARRDTDAIFFANDILATGGIDALRDEAGLRVPEDVAVAGFDDIAMAGWPRYALTTYRQPVDEIVGVTVKMIEDGSCQPGQPSSINRLPGSLIVRRSTGASAPKQAASQ